MPRLPSFVAKISLSVRMSLAAGLLTVMASAALPVAGVAAPVEPPPLVIQPTGAGSAEAARLCRDLWSNQGIRLTAELVPAGAVLDTVRVFLMPTDAFQRNFGARIPDWGVGVALRPGRVVAIDHSRLPAVGRGVSEVFLHEMVHALLMQATEDAWLPTWLHEGAAVWLSGEWRFTDTVAVVFSGRVPNLTRLRAPFPRGAAGADMAYRTSLLAMERLRRWYGDDILARLTASTARSGDFPTAFAEVTGEELEDFEARFAGAMQLRYGWVVLIFRWPTLFVIMALVFVVGAVRRIVRSRRRLAEMED